MSRRLTSRLVRLRQRFVFASQLGLNDGMADHIRIIRHEAVPKCGSFEVRFADGRESRFFYWDDLPSRRVRPEAVAVARQLNPTARLPLNCSLPAMPTATAGRSRGRRSKTSWRADRGPQHSASPAASVADDAAVRQPRWQSGFRRRRPVGRLDPVDSGARQPVIPTALMIDCSPCSCGD